MRNVLFTALISLALASCYQRAPLEIYYQDMAQIRLEVDWLNHMEEKPSGMTVLLAKDGDTFTTQRITNNVDSMYLRLEAGTYKLLLLSNAFDEFGSIHFDGQTSFGNVVVRADNLTSRMNQAWDRGVKYMKTPDVLGVALDTLTVTQEDIDKNRHFIDWRQRFAPDTISIVHRETVYPITSRLNLYVRVQGYKFMRSLEGSISGMADGCYLSRFQNTNEYGPHFLDSWTHRVGTRQDVMKPENVNPVQDDLYPADTLSHDWLFASIPVFGLPGNTPEDMAQRNPESNVLTLCFTLVDGTSHVYRFNVGDLFRYRNSAITDISGTHVKSDGTAEIGLNLVIDLPRTRVDLPYAEDPGSSSGNASSFDVVVDDWEEGDTVDVGL